MTPRERALVLRLAAIAETGEWGAHNLRRELSRYGWDDAAMSAAVARVRTAVRGLLEQSELFERAA
jgi:hypothetical protein